MPIILDKDTAEVATRLAFTPIVGVLEKEHTDAVYIAVGIPHGNGACVLYECIVGKIMRKQWKKNHGERARALVKASCAHRRQCTDDGEPLLPTMTANYRPEGLTFFYDKETTFAVATSGSVPVANQSISLFVGLLCLGKLGIPVPLLPRMKQ